MERCHIFCCSFLNSRNCTFKLQKLAVKVNQIKFISPESLKTGREQRKTNWSPMSAAPEAKLLNNTGEYLIITKIKRKSKKNTFAYNTQKTVAYNTHKDQLLSKFYFIKS